MLIILYLKNVFNGFEKLVGSREVHYNNPQKIEVNERNVATCSI